MAAKSAVPKSTAAKSTAAKSTISMTGGAGLAAALGAAMLLGAGAGTAYAAPAEGGANLAKTDLAQALGGTTAGLGYGIAPIKDLRVDPWANSSADVLNNGATVRPEDTGLAPVSTSTLTGPLSAGGGPRDLPVVGQLLGALPG